MSSVSCIIPFYNGAETIARAIDSVINEPLCLEVIVVADASPQPLRPCLTPAQNEAATAGKLRLVEMASNHGQASARNIGVALAAGDYVSFLDQDDCYLPGFYSAVVPYLAANPHIAAVQCGAQYVQGEETVLDAPDPRYFASLNTVPWNLVIRRLAFWASGAFPTEAAFRSAAAGEDIAFKKGLVEWFQIAVTDDKFVRHYSRPGSATDRFLKRTSVVDGKIIFAEGAADVADNEADARVVAAVRTHLQRARTALQALLKLKVK